MTTLITYNSLFKAAWHHVILMNNNPSIRPGKGGCAYRGMNDTRCVVGVLIPDDVAHKSEGTTAGDIAACYPNLFSQDIVDSMGEDYVKINDMQCQLHDHLLGHRVRYTDPAQWKWSRSGMLRHYLHIAEIHQIDTSWINIPVTHTLEECKQLIWQLEFGELDGWHYIIESVYYGDQYHIAVLDENGKFVSFWCM